MPNRILRESILDSEAVDQLSVAAEVFYRRLMSVVDDFGRFDARPSVLRSRCYPLRVTTAREADISRWLAECEKAGLIVLYSVDGKQYLLFHKLGEPRAKSSKFPAPPAGTVAAARTCAHMRPYSSSDSDSGAGSEPPRSEIMEELDEAAIGRLVGHFDRVYRGPPLEDGEIERAVRSIAHLPEPKIAAEIDRRGRKKREYPGVLAERLDGNGAATLDEYTASARRSRHE